MSTSSLAIGDVCIQFPSTMFTTNSCPEFGDAINNLGLYTLVTGNQNLVFVREWYILLRNLLQLHRHMIILRNAFASWQSELCNAPRILVFLCIFCAVENGSHSVYTGIISTCTFIKSPVSISWGNEFTNRGLLLHGHEEWDVFYLAGKLDNLTFANAYTAPLVKLFNPTTTCCI